MILSALVCASFHAGTKALVLRVEASCGCWRSRSDLTGFERQLPRYLAELRVEVLVLPAMIFLAAL